MIRQNLSSRISSAVAQMISSGELPPADYSIEIADTKSPEYGDFACNFAMIAAKKAGKSPREIAEKLKSYLENSQGITKIDVAGPGFLNFFLDPTYLSSLLVERLESGKSLTQSQTANPKKINVEFVSVNPNGPITVGSGRGAAFGDTLCNVLSAAGHQVHREYYINDGINSEQMRLFADSVKHYVLDFLGMHTTFPEGGYKGDYVADVAKEVLDQYGPECAKNDLEWFQKVSQDMMLARQKNDLAVFHVEFDTWFSEQSLYDSNEVNKSLQFLAEKKVTEHREGALWLRSTLFGDDKDRVLVRENGRPTYITSDIAYHKSKLERGADKLIDIWGPDHHGYIGRMKAAIQALGYPEDTLDIAIFQIVRLVREREVVPMRKRDGNIYALSDLIKEIGSDNARFFYLMRSHETHMDFDIDLAKQQSDENPVYYVQYAHARICSILKKASEEGFSPTSKNAYLLIDPREKSLIKKILDISYEVERCANDYGVHRLTTYSVELARAFHHFYDACRVIQHHNPALADARLFLCVATKTALKNLFDLLGISAPEHMERPVAE